ncbi:unnamed protein product, partial [Vitis vinifera]
MKKSTAKEEGASDNGEKKDFLQFLLDLKVQEDTETPITMTQIKALLMDILVGGTDTTATMVEWVMAEMIRNPVIMTRAQEELTNVVGMGSIVEESHLPKLQYMDAVIKESLRLHPALPLLVPKCPSQDCTVGGYTIAKGTKVFLNVWAIHRDPQIWDSPSEFKPERFLSEPGRWDYTGNNFQYLPFGSGRRICAGIPLAERMIIYLLASLLHSFNWQLPEGEDLDLSEKFGIVLKKRTPLIAFIQALVVPAFSFPGISFNTMVSHHLERATTAISSYWIWWWEATSKKDQVNQAVLTVLIAIFATSWYLWASLRARKRTAPLPPGPRGLPIVGYLPFLGSNLHHSFAELADIYGPIFKLWLGNRLCIVLTSPSLAKELFVREMLSNKYP